MSANTTFGLASLWNPMPVISLVTRFGKRAWSGLDNLRYARYSNRTLANLTTFQLDEQGDEIRPPPIRPAHVPSAWSFLFSKFAVSLIVMHLQSILMSRIRNIVVPPPRRRHRDPPAPLLRYLLPIDTSATRTRLLFRLPSLYYVLRSVTLLTVILLQVSGYSLSSWSVLADLDRWAAAKEFKDVCWTVFKSVCFVVLTWGFYNGLEMGHARENENAFNLVAYGFLLHLYSFPYNRDTANEDSTPSRPDKHVIITILLPLYQLALAHIMSIWKKWSTRRLIPTAICGILGQIHFIYVVSSSPATYPTFAFFEGLVEAFFTFIVLFTVSLRALTQLLLDGHLSLSVLGHESTLPTIDDDYSVALLKLGTSCLDATRVAGMGNEVAGLNETAEDTVVQLNRWSAEIKGSGYGLAGFAREIRTIKARRGDERVEMGLVHSEWLRNVQAFGLAFLQTAVVLYRALHHKIFGPFTEVDDVPPRHRMEPGHGALALRPRMERTDTGDTIYARFLAGEDSDDEGDADYRDNGFDEDSDGESDSDSTGESPTAAREDSALYADLMQPGAGATSTALAPVLVAHLTSDGSVITRRRYRQMVARPVEDEADPVWANFVRERRARPQRVEAEEGERSTCVVCTVEPRSVIIWPCRCLALCDDCRANIAARFNSSKHVCPCCRQKVEGYSRVFIP